MRLAITLRQFNPAEMGGLEYYVRRVVGGLTEEASIDVTIFTPAHRVADVRSFAPRAEIRALPESENWILEGDGCERRAPSMERAIRSEGFDAIFCPVLVLDPLNPGIPSAVAIPDIQHEFMPENFGAQMLAWRRRTYRRSARRADIVFTPSQFSKRTICEAYGVEPSKVVVTPHDVDPEFRAPPPARPSRELVRLELRNPFLYVPANFWPHKNHTKILEALRLVRDHHPQVCLVFSGALETGADRVAGEVVKLRLGNRVRFVGHQPRPVTVELFRNAAAVVFVSRFEGFGRPPLEAFHAGTPVLASRAGSCEEVAGDAALYVDPDSPADIARGMSRLLEDVGLRKALIERGRARTRRFSSRKSFELVRSGLASIAAPSSSGGRWRHARRVTA
jgi:glycosyltransferase involved in cell wall biosynthesis